jgi:hypothetical protein
MIFTLVFVVVFGHKYCASSPFGLLEVGFGKRRKISFIIIFIINNYLNGLLSFRQIFFFRPGSPYGFLADPNRHI